MTVIAAFLASTTGKAAFAAVLFALGFLTKSSIYRKCRGALGKCAYGCGVGITAFGRTKLRVLWNPLENIFMDFCVFPLEQLAAGMRAGKVDRLEEQIHRLEDVGSDSRKKALEEKVVTLRKKEAFDEKLGILRDAEANPQPIQDQADIIRDAEARFKERAKDNL